MVEGEGAPATPAGRRAAWLLDRLAGHAAGSDAEALTPELAQRMGLADRADWWGDFATRLSPIRGAAFEPISESEIAILLDTAADRRSRLTLAVESEPPHRIERFDWRRQHDFELEVREATPADALTLAELERRCPIVAGETSVGFDRGAAFFDFARLMEDVTVGIAFVEGEPGAMTCGACHTIRVGGEDKRIVTVSHLRVLPEHQKKGLWGEVNRVLEKYWPTVDGSAAFIAVENAAMQHGFRTTPDKWPSLIRWRQLDTAALAGPPAGRPATPADAGQIVSLLNGFHGEEEVFVPYDEVSLAARLARAPDLYGWGNLWLADGAVLGVWPAGQAMRRTMTKSGVATAIEPGLVLDYAWADGAWDAFEALVRAWCAKLAGMGLGRLSIFTSLNSPGCERIGALAAEDQAFDFWTPGVKVPSDAASRGLYVDPVYF